MTPIDISLLDALGGFVWFAVLIAAGIALVAVSWTRLPRTPRAKRMIAAGGYVTALVGVLLGVGAIDTTHISSYREAVAEHYGLSLTDRQISELGFPLTTPTEFAAYGSTTYATPSTEDGMPTQITTLHLIHEGGRLLIGTVDSAATFTELPTD